MLHITQTPTADSVRLATLEVPALEALITSLQGQIEAHSLLAGFPGLDTSEARCNELLALTRATLAARHAAAEHLVSGAFPASATVDVLAPQAALLAARPDIHEIAAGVTTRLVERFPGLGRIDAACLVRDEIEAQTSRALDEVGNTVQNIQRAFANSRLLSYAERLEARCSRVAPHIVMSRSLAPHLEELEAVAGEMLDTLDERGLTWSMFLAAKDAFF